MLHQNRLGSIISVLTLFGLLALAGPTVSAQPCEVVDNGSGTIDMPPPGCGYVSPDTFHMIIDGIPPTTQINVDASHEKFFNVNSGPGGNLGGEQEEFDSILFLQMDGVGPPLDGFSRSIVVQVHSETHIAPRVPGAPVQDFDTEMVSLSGELFGDPDFCTFRVRGGSSFGLPSPGHTTLTRLPSGNFNVDSFFDITYQIEFQGCPGSILEGMGGTTTATVRMGAGEPVPAQPPCTVVDNGTGTVDLPPDGCDYVSPEDLHVMLDGLPPGTEVNIAPSHNRFINITTTPGGNLGGEVETFSSNLRFQMAGTGDLSGFLRDVTIPTQCETHTGPRNPGDAVQDFDTEMVALQGELFGDPDFCTLKVRAGDAHGLPSPGHTTLTRLPSGDFNVDSFFDITYQIEFQGCPGSQLDGMGGTTTGTVRIGTGAPATCPPIPAGDDIFPSTAKLVVRPLQSSDLPFVLRLSDAGLPPTLIQRQPQVGDTIPTEMISMQLSGNHPRVGGPVTVRAGSAFGLPASTGAIENVVQDPSSCELTAGDSFFDVFVEVEVPALGEVWRNDPTDPLHVQRRITKLPPKDDPYENPFVRPVLLFDQATGEARAEVLYELHHADPPLPPPGQDCFDTFLEAVLDLPPLGVFNQGVLLQGPTTVGREQPFPLGFTCCASGETCQSDLDCPADDSCTCSGPAAVETEMLSMDLVGFDPLLGEVSVTESQTRLSPGLIQSQLPDRTYFVDSFFDVFFDVTLQDAGLRLHGDRHLTVSNIGSSGKDGVSNIPPDPQEQFSSVPGEAVVLLTEDGQPVGEIRDVNHIIGPPRDWQPPPPPDDDCFDSWLHLEITIFNPFCQETLWLPSVFRVLRDRPEDPDGLGMEIIETLMAKGLFTADSQCVGALKGVLDPDLESKGDVRSLTPDEFFPAESFFDVHVRLDTGIGTLSAGPLHMETTVNNLPPDEGEIYYGPGTTIPLYDASGLQIGEILELEHEVHAAVDCPADCLPQIVFGEVPGTDDPAFDGVASAKDRISVGIFAGAGGVVYDVARGSLSNLHSTGGGMASATCIQDDGGHRLIDPTIPAPGSGFFYLARDGFKNYVGTWNSLGPNQVGDRDGKVSACTP